MTELIILTRTTRRPHYFDGLTKSIAAQANSKNIHWLICYERDIDLNYVVESLSKYPNLKYSAIQVHHHKWDKKQLYEIDSKFAEIKYHLRNSPYNLHLNTLLAEAKKYYPTEDIPVIYLDDDDCFTKPNSAQIIVDEFKSNNEKLILWLVDMQTKIVPEVEYWNKPPEIFHISGIGMAHSLKYADEAKWDEKSCSDFRVADALYKKYGVHYVSDLLTKIQRKKAGGNGKMDDISKPLGKKQIFSYNE
jgi:hypothetical protein